MCVCVCVLEREREALVAFLTGVTGKKEKNTTGTAGKNQSR